MPTPAPIPTFLRAAVAIIDSERGNPMASIDDWHRQARETVEILQHGLRSYDTLRAFERELGAGNMFLGRLLRDYPWLADGTGFEHVARNKSTSR